MELMDHRGMPRGLVRLQAVRSMQHRTFKRDNCHSRKESCQAAHPRIAIPAYFDVDFFRNGVLTIDARLNFS
jgi:hypothetical protein